MPLTPSLSPRCCAAPVPLRASPRPPRLADTRIKHQGKTSMAIKGVSFMCATRTRTTRPLVPDEPQTAFTFTRATSTALLDSPPSAATLCLCAIVEGGSQHDDRMRVPSAPGARLAVTVGHGQSQTVAAGGRRGSAANGSGHCSTSLYPLSSNLIPPATVSLLAVTELSQY